jgi:hypothetical protein
MPVKLIVSRFSCKFRINYVKVLQIISGVHTSKGAQQTLDERDGRKPIETSRGLRQTPSARGDAHSSVK